MKFDLAEMIEVELNELRLSPLFSKFIQFDEQAG
ncbi:MAG: hypothetical protein ACI9ZV_000282 [Candidatus Azotimanducaceae bacterium]|jgi:hypothetical protein